MKIRRLGEYELTWRWDEPPDDLRRFLWDELHEAVHAHDLGLTQKLCGLLDLVDRYYLWKDRRDHSVSETYENDFGHATEDENEFAIIIEDPVSWRVQQWLQDAEEAQR